MTKRDYPDVFQPAKGITLYRGNCLDILPTLTGVDAVISDPPYGMNWNTNTLRFSGGQSPLIVRKRGHGKDWGGE